MRNWFITGVSSGLGRALAEEVLAVGDVVFGTVRSEVDLRSFEGLDAERAIGFVLDLTDGARIPGVIAEAERRVGGIDVLVNNAGYGLIGAVEEISIAELRAVFEVNFFAAFSCIRAVLPMFRDRGAGHIVNITSVSGLAPWAGTAAYGSSKYALEGLGQTLAQEMQEFGIRVTNVEPGGLATDFAKRSLATADLEIEDYRKTAAHVPRQIFSSGDSLTGNVRKAAQAIIAAVDADEPPVHLLLGEDAIRYAEQQTDAFSHDKEKWMSLTKSINN